MSNEANRPDPARFSPVEWQAVIQANRRVRKAPPMVEDEAKDDVEQGDLFSGEES